MNTPTSSIHQSLGYWASLLARSMEAEFNKRLAVHDQTRLSWAVLGAMAFDGIDTPSGLADFLQVDRAAITRLLDKLVAQALVLRHPKDGDRRSIALSVTPQGAALAAELLELSRAVNAQFTSGLDPAEAELFITTVKKMLGNSSQAVGTL